jgi:hypothetical protein
MSPTGWLVRALHFDCLTERVRFLQESQKRTRITWAFLASWKARRMRNTWSVAGESDRADVNFLLAQWFLNYNLGQGWAVNFLLGYCANSDHPEGGPESQVRFQVNFMFPQKRERESRGQTHWRRLSSLRGRGPADCVGGGGSARRIALTVSPRS